MPGKDPARGARDTGRTSRGLNDRDRTGGGGGRLSGRDIKVDNGLGFGAGMSTGDAGIGADNGLSGKGIGTRGTNAGIGGGIGNRDKDRNSQSTSTPKNSTILAALPSTKKTAPLPSKSLGRKISDLFGGPAAYANNPNTPGYDTKDMGVPIEALGLTPASLMAGQNAGMSPAASAAVDAIAGTMSGIGPALGLTRTIQAATGMTGGPAPGGYGDNLGKKPRDTADVVKEEENLKRKKQAQQTLLGTGASTSPLGVDKAGNPVQPI